MKHILYAEYIKHQHTLGKTIPIIAPVITLLLVLILTGGMDNAFPAGAWNWWYATLLPGMLAVMAYLNIALEKKNRYYYLIILSVSKKKLMLGKIIYLSLALFLANVILFIGAAIGGVFWGTTISIDGAAFGMLLLTVSYLWEIPFYLFLSARFGMFADIFLCMAISIGGVVTVSDTNFWWTCPSAIPIRLMCPTLGLLPNGLSVPIDSILQNTNVILPGILLSLVWFVIAAFLFLNWFNRMEVK